MSESGRGGLGDILTGSKLPCPECGHNRLNTYADGHSHCFHVGCGFHTPPDSEHRGEVRSPRKITGRGLLRPEEGAWAPLTKRKLSSETLRRFGYFQAGYGGSMSQVAPVYDQTGNLVAQEVFTREGKVVTLREGGSVGDFPDRDAQLWGMHVFGDRNDRRVVVCVGGPETARFDCMSTAQATQFKMPCVSVNKGDTGAANSVKLNYRWLDRFQEIILFPRADTTGERLAQEIAELFPVGKVKIARISGALGPNQALQQDRAGDILNAVYSALPWRPLGIVNASTLRDRIFKEGLQTPSWPFPWPIMNERTMGMAPGEVIYHVGGTGIAKTTLMLHCVDHLIQDDGQPFLEGYPRQPPAKVGFMGFEDLPKQALVALLGIHRGLMLSLKAVPEKKAVKWFDELFASGRLELYDAEQAEYGLEAIKGYIRYMARALDCKVIFLDPLTFVVSQLPAQHRDQEEQRLAGWLAAEAKSLGICIHVGYHLRKPNGEPFEEGAPIGLPDIKGSGALTHFAHNLMAYERDQQGTRPDLLRVRWLKNRRARFTGVGCILKYDMETGRYEPTDEPWPDKDDDDGKHGSATRGSKGFAEHKPLETGKDY